MLRSNLSSHDDSLYALVSLPELKMTDRLHMTFQNLDLAVFASVDPFPHRENPEDTATAIQAFFKRTNWQ